MQKVNIFKKGGTSAALDYIEARIDSLGEPVLVTISDSGLVWARAVYLLDEYRKTKLVKSDGFIGIYGNAIGRKEISDDLGAWFVSRGENLDSLGA